MAKIQRLTYEYEGIPIPCHLYTTRSNVDTLELLEYVYWGAEGAVSRKEIHSWASDPDAPIKYGWDLARATDHLLKTGQFERVGRGVYKPAGLSPRPRLLPSPTPMRDLICAKGGDAQEVSVLCRILKDPSILHDHMKEEHSNE